MQPIPRNIDYLTIEVNVGGKDVHILVTTDHFTFYAQAIVTSSQTANVQPKTMGQIHCPLWGS